MLSALGRIFHKLLNPHCPDCAMERECKSCDMLRSMLENERAEKNKILQMLLPAQKTEQIETREIDTSKFHKSWKVRQQELEANARVEARILKEKEKIEEIEKELEHAN